MATVAQWIEGARPRTLPNAVAPVLVGVGAAYQVVGFVWWHAALAVIVSLCLTIGVNYANDYSDGIRGTDDQRVGPLRLVGSGSAKPRGVLIVAMVALGVAGLSGVVLVVLTGRWWMVVVGAASIAAAWFYTGGPKPYGYSGFGEIAVFVFFGPVAVLGTQYVLSGRITGTAIGCAVAVGAFISAVLVVNNLRDIPTDTEAGKRTLAVRLGDRDTRSLYITLIAIPFLLTTVIGLKTPLAWLGFLAIPLVIAPLRTVARDGSGRKLIPVLRDTGLATLVWAIATSCALVLSR